MNTLKFSVRSFSRDFKAGELFVLFLAVIVAVTSITAVGFFTDRVGRAMESQAAATLAADLVIRSPAPIAESLIDIGNEFGLKTAVVIDFPSVAQFGEDTSLSIVYGVSSNYPLRGEVRISDELFTTSYIAKGVPLQGTIWAEPGLMARLDVDVGDDIKLGSAVFKIAHVLEFRPDQGVGFASMAPALLMNIEDVPSMNVLKAGSRFTYRQLYAGSIELIDRFGAKVRPLVTDQERIRTIKDAGEQIVSAINRAKRFLTLSSLVTVILAAVATAMASRRYALRHLDTVALLKSLGAKQSFILNSSIVQLVLIILLTTLIGTLFGYLAQFLLAAVLAEITPFELPKPSWWTSIIGLVTSSTIAIGFALPHFLQLRVTPPIRVLRKNISPPPLHSGLVYGIALGALITILWVIVREPILLSLILSGVIGLAILSGLSGWLLVIIFTRFRGLGGITWRYGLANISRRGKESVVQIVAFGLSLMVLLLLTIVRNDLITNWQRTLPENAPNYFLFNIQPEDWDRISQIFTEELGEKPDFLPLIRGRMTSIKGIPIEEYTFPTPQGRNSLRQEANLTWTADLPESNRITEGEWWGENYNGELQVSLAADYARNLDVEVGDSLGFMVGGEKIDVKVTSLREIAWDSLTPNFYLIFSPGDVSQLPQTYLSSLYIGEDSRQVLKILLQKFPSVTLLDLKTTLGQIRNIINRASAAVQYVFLFTLLAGIVVLLAAIQVTRDERRFESAILHTLGAQRKQILKGVASEFIALGALAGLLASIGATVVSYFLAKQAFNMDYQIDPSLWLVGLLSGAIIVGCTGTFATRKAVMEPPVAVLRNN
ncbi:MAG: FtsX-like permease family protein [Pseudomonadota bacterium]|nr:FtsX-like permease family protein [Pseudomonadota bacterium]